MQGFLLLFTSETLIGLRVSFIRKLNWKVSFSFSDWENELGVHCCINVFSRFHSFNHHLLCVDSSFSRMYTVHSQNCSLMLQSVNFKLTFNFTSIISTFTHRPASIKTEQTCRLLSFWLNSPLYYIWRNFVMGFNYNKIRAKNPYECIM